jgi:hypothetical protein
MGLPVSRLKTGTPARLDGRSIDWAALEWQHGDADHPRFSHSGTPNAWPPLPCAITVSYARRRLIPRVIERDDSPACVYLAPPPGPASAGPAKPPPPQDVTLSSW